MDITTIIAYSFGSIVKKGVTFVVTNNSNGSVTEHLSIADAWYVFSSFEGCDPSIEAAPRCVREHI